MIRAAQFYARCGVPVFPCHSTARGRCTCDARDCDSPAKHPRTKNGLLDAATDRDAIEAWWRCWPDANIALACGPANLYVIDIDPRHAGDDTIAALQREHVSLDDTLWQRTGSGGWHAIYTDSSGLKNTTGRLGGGVDTRGRGGYILAAPSLHASGRRYEWWNPGTAIAPLPAWLRRLLVAERVRPPVRPPPRRPDGGDTNAATIERIARYVARTPEGSRNAILFWACCELLDHGVPQDELRVVMLDAARACGLAQREAKQTIQSALRRASA